MTSKDIVACSECFDDEGLRMDARSMGLHDSSTCPRCEACDGKKLNRDGIEKLARSFFVWGSYHKTTFGGAPILNIEHLPEPTIPSHSANQGFRFMITQLLEGHLFDGEDYTAMDSESKKAWCIKDKALLEDILNVRITLNAPREYDVGITENLENLRQGDKYEQIISKILESYPTREFTPNDKFYRLRNLDRGESSEFDPTDGMQFDSPPPRIGNDEEKEVEYGRFDSCDLSVLYGAPELATCLHECRVTKEQDLYVATLKPTRSLQLLDLCVFPDEIDTNPFVSIDHTVASLFEEGSDVYPISRKLALAAQNEGYEGVIYPSFYSDLHNGKRSSEPEKGPSSKPWVSKNIGIFGKPIQDERLLITCINRMHLQEVEYTFYFGPADPFQSF